jgi:transcriptional regulator with XRE-family HTH domain
MRMVKSSSGDGRILPGVGVTSPNAPEIKFAAILSDLVENSPYRTNRRPIWEAIGVSSAALSQYTLGRARPRFESLAAIADFFGVTLDYLLLGRESTRNVPDESQSVARYVDWALNDLQSKIGRRAWLTARVGQLLVERIEEAVDRASVMPIGGMLTVDDAIGLERHSLATYVWNTRLGYDVVELPDGSVAPGRFAPVVAENLMANPPRPYYFMLYEQPNQPLVNAVHDFQRMLRDDFGVPEERLRFCQFRKTAMPVVVGCCLYRLDVAALSIQEPTLTLAVADHTGPDGAIGYSCSADDSTRAETLLSPSRASSSLTLFESLWRDTTSPF